MGTTGLRRRNSALAAGLATLALAVGFAASPAGAAPPDVDYVALGDSYTAGIGAGPSFAGPGNCIQAPGGYVDMVGKTGRVDLLRNAACAGATLDGGLTSVAGQLSNAQTLAALREAELVTITAGPNDLNFPRVIGACVSPSIELCDDAVGQATSPSTLSALTQGLATTYDAIQALAPNATVVVLGYPQLFDPTVPFPALPAPPENLQRVADGTLDVNDAIKAAADQAGAEYVDVVDEFAGHEVNSGDPWIFFGIVHANGMPAPDPRSFHPTLEGHRAYASALLASIKLGQLVRP